MTEQAMPAADLPNSAPSDQSVPELQDRNKGYKRRILHLLEEIFGPSRHNQIQGLLNVRKGAQIVIASDTQLKAAYQRGRADLLAEMDFSERLAAVRAKYPDFDRSWATVRPLVPRVVWQEMADHPDGLECAYQLSKLPELCQELSQLEPQKAVERFQYFVKDLALVMKGAR